LENELLDAIAVALEDAQHFRLERAGLFGDRSEGSLQLVAKVATSFFPFFACRWRFVGVAEPSGLGLDEVEVFALPFVGNLGK
jgi:hypothetical protein